MVVVDGMSPLRELDRLAVNAVSPDRSLRVSLTARSGLRIETGPRREPPRSETELARQVSVTVNGVLRAYQELANELSERYAASLPAGHESALMHESLRRCDAEIERIRVSTISPRRAVSVSITGRSTIDVAIRPRSLDRYDEKVLLGEIGDSVANVLALRSNREIEICKSNLSDTSI